MARSIGGLQRTSEDLPFRRIEMVRGRIYGDGVLDEQRPRTRRKPVVFDADVSIEVVLDSYPTFRLHQRWNLDASLDGITLDGPALCRTVGLVLQVFPQPSGGGFLLLRPAPPDVVREWRSVKRLSLHRGRRHSPANGIGRWANQLDGRRKDAMQRPSLQELAERIRRAA